jgi:aspartate racemase
MKKHNIKVGILGGIGPEATGNFYLDLIRELQKSVKNNSDFPQIIINSIPAPELIGEIISDTELEPYINGLKILEKNEVDFIVMVCNTIHIFHERLQKKISTEILDLRKEVRNKIEKTSIKNISIFGTNSTISNGLYEFEGKIYKSPDDTEKNIIKESIFLFNKGEDKKRQIEKVREIAQRHLDSGSETILLACTELDLMIKKSGIPNISTINVLKDATIRKIQESKSI